MLINIIAVPQFSKFVDDMAGGKYGPYVIGGTAIYGLSPNDSTSGGVIAALKSTNTGTNFAIIDESHEPGNINEDDNSRVGGGWDSCLNNGTKIWVLYRDHPLTTDTASRMFVNYFLNDLWGTTPIDTTIPFAAEGSVGSVGQEFFDNGAQRVFDLAVPKQFIAARSDDSLVITYAAFQQSGTGGILPIVPRYATMSTAGVWTIGSMTRGDGFELAQAVAVNDDSIMYSPCSIVTGSNNLVHMFYIALTNTSPFNFANLSVSLHHRSLNTSGALSTDQVVATNLQIAQGQTLANGTNVNASIVGIATYDATSNNVVLPFLTQTSTNGSPPKLTVAIATSQSSPSWVVEDVDNTKVPLPYVHPNGGATSTANQGLPNNCSAMWVDGSAMVVWQGGPEPNNQNIWLGTRTAVGSWTASQIYNSSPLLVVDLVGMIGIPTNTNGHFNIFTQLWNPGTNTATKLYNQPNNVFYGPIGTVAPAVGGFFLSHLNLTY